MNKKKKIFGVIRIIVIILLFGVFSYSGYRMYSGLDEYRKAEKERERLEQYEPEDIADDDISKGSKKVAELIERYPDVVGWLKLRGTVISYPFVQTENNNDYLHHSLEGEELRAGTLFMDYRNSADISDFNSIIYGHNMQNGSMFGTLKDFVNSETHWESHKRGWIYLPKNTLKLEIFAIITVHQSDGIIYNIGYPDDASKEKFLAHVRQNANRWRDIGAGIEDRFVSLSTCATATSPYRYVLVARVL